MIPRPTSALLLFIISPWVHGEVGPGDPVDPGTLPQIQKAAADFLAAGDRAGAIKLFRDLAASQPRDLASQLAYADFLTAQANGDSLALKLATGTLESALLENPGHPEIIQRLFDLAGVSGNKTRQEELLGFLSPSQPAGVLLYARLSQQLHPGDDATTRAPVDERFRAATAAQAENPDLARAAAEYFRDTGRLGDAISVLERHVASAPESLDLRAQLGVLYFEAKRGADGETALKELLTAAPTHPLAHATLAEYFKVHGQTSLARLHTAELLKIRGGKPEEFMTLAGEFLAADAPKDARVLLEKAVSDHPKEYTLAAELAVATRRDPTTRQEAANRFREAEAIRPAGTKPAPAFLLEFAAASLDHGDTKAAEDQLRAAIRAFPAEAKKESAAALRQLAGIWESENRNLDAARALKQRADALER